MIHNTTIITAALSSPLIYTICVSQYIIKRQCSHERVGLPSEIASWALLHHPLRFHYDISILCSRGRRKEKKEMSMPLSFVRPLVYIRIQTEACLSDYLCIVHGDLTIAAPTLHRHVSTIRVVYSISLWMRSPTHCTINYLGKSGASELKQVGGTSWTFLISGIFQGPYQSTFIGMY